MPDFDPVVVRDGLKEEDGILLIGLILGGEARVDRRADFDGDGIDDIQWLVPIQALGGSPDVGAAFLIKGQSKGPLSYSISDYDPAEENHADPNFSGLTIADDPSQPPGFRLDGQMKYAATGFSATLAGDINGDGFGDWLIGAPGAGAPVPDEDFGDARGFAYLVFGSATLPQTGFDLVDLNGTDGFRLEGANPYDYSGRAVAMGDVNGDGFDDMIVGGDRADPLGRAYAGITYVVFGSADPFAASIGLATLTPEQGFAILGAAADDYSGRSLAVADFNGDGMDDIVIGAYRADPDGNAGAGSTFVVFGSDAGFAGNVDLGALGAAGIRIDGVDGGDRSGFSVASAGDFNGDGYEDLIIGADSAGESYSGRAYIVFGSETPGDVDLADLDGTDGFSIGGAGVYDQLGGSVSGTGDVNGDGFDDVIIGARWVNSPTAGGAGSAFVIFGGPAGFGVFFDVTTLDGANGFRFDGGANDYAGTHVSGGGDVNGDGFSDIAFSAPGAGEGYIIFGRAPQSAVARTGSAAGQTIRGGGFNDTLNGLGGDDTLIGSNGDDVLVGGKGHDVMNGGKGDDVYRVQQAGDRIFESTGRGEDTVLASVDYDAGTNEIERIVARSGAGLSLEAGIGDALVKGGGGNDTLTGGSGHDRLKGGAGDDRLVASEGGDFLIGGPGQDTIVLGRQIAGSERPGIAGFLSGVDRMEVDGSDFGGGLSAGPLDPDAFVTNTTGFAEDSEDRFIYDSNSGKLYFDVDGTGAEARVLIARLTGAPSLSASDFDIVGTVPAMSALVDMLTVQATVPELRGMDGPGLALF